MYENYLLEWPNHTDFLQLVERGEADIKSLYNKETDMYEGPETLAERGLSYDEFVAMQPKESNEVAAPAVETPAEETVAE